MCLPVLAFVTKRNKELEKSWERKPKWKGGRRVKRGPENEARKEKLRDCLEKWSGSKMLQWLEFIFRNKKGYDTVDKPELGRARPCVCLTSGHMFAWLTTPKTLPNAHLQRNANTNTWTKKSQPLTCIQTHHCHRSPLAGGGLAFNQSAMSRWAPSRFAVHHRVISLSLSFSIHSLLCP